MGNKLIIKQINKEYDTREAVENLLHYIVRDKFNKGHLESRVRCWKAFGASQKDIDKTCRQFIKIQELAGKDCKKRIRHLVIIFPSSVTEIRQVLIAAEAVALFLFEDYQVMYGVHEKEHQLHIHFAFNPVSYKTFRKWHMSHGEFYEWKQSILKIINELLFHNSYDTLEM